MTISRRHALQGLITAGAAGTAVSCAQSPTQANVDALLAPAAAQISGAARNLTVPDIATEPMLNVARAVDVMAAEKVDLILCRQPVNLFYLTNQRIISDVLGMDGMAYAAFAPTGRQRPALVTGSFSYYLSSDNTVVPEQVDLRLFSRPAEPEAYGLLEDAAAVRSAQAGPDYLTPTFKDAPARNYETARRANIDKAKQEISAGAESALLKVLHETDLPNKTVAIDDHRIVELLKRSGLDLKFVDGDRLLRRIRLQKTPQEIVYQRYAAKANAAAGQAAAKLVEDGASFSNLRTAFATECAKRSTSPVYILIDGIIAPLTDEKILPGRAFLIDCVSSFMGYHGDYGRTVCVGEPTPKMGSVIDALSSVWDRMLPELTPGTTYAEIFTLGQKFFAETKVDAGLILGPHSVGLRHTDEPSARDFGTFEKDNLTLQENMIISVDMPVLGSGLGGTAHLEDLVLIGKDGPELLNQTDDRFIVV